MTDSQHLTTPQTKITINGATYPVAPGRYPVSKLKSLAGVPLADDLEQIVDGQLVPLPDEGFVEIKGGEQFLSHPKTGQSS